MMEMPMPEPSIEQRIDDARYYAYNAIAGGLNRAERRTAKGKLIVAQAEIAALKAENEVLRQVAKDGEA